MTALSDAELDGMRSAAESILTSTCTIQALARASDGQGGWPETWSDAYTGVACLLAAPTQTEYTDTSGNRFKVGNSWTLSVHWDQALEVNNRVILNGDTFTVTGVQDDQDMRILRVATLDRVDG